MSIILLRYPVLLFFFLLHPRIANLSLPKFSGMKKLAMEDFSPAGLRVLVVDDDPLCLMVLERMLCQCLYKVTTCNSVSKALALLMEDNERFDLVISDVYMPDDDGFKLLEVIGLNLDLPVIMMSADGDTSVVMKGITHGACDYLIKPVRMENLRNIWQHVVRRRVLESPKEDNRPDLNRFDKPMKEQDPLLKKRKEQVVSSDDAVDDISDLKKARVNWSVQLHQQFVDAVNKLGIDKAVPKKILEIMNVQGLTRENVASHLQKYRLFLKRLSGVKEGPSPVASFQAFEGDKFGGCMKVKPRGKSAAPMNFGASVRTSPSSPRKYRSVSLQTQQKVNRTREAANRAQVFGGLGLTDQVAGEVPIIPFQPGIQRMASLDLGFLEKPQQSIQRMASLDLGFLEKTFREEVETSSTPSVDDLVALNFQSIMKLENMKDSVKCFQSSMVQCPLIPCDSNATPIFDSVTSSASKEEEGFPQEFSDTSRESSSKVNYFSLDVSDYVGGRDFSQP